MSLNIVRLVLLHHYPSAPLILGWQGGEPTLAGLPWFEQVMAIMPPGVSHTLMTNGTLIDENWARFLAEHRFLVGVSIDGTEKEHNVHRAEWAKTVAAIQMLLAHGVETNAVVTVNLANWNHGVKIYRSLVQMGLTYFQFIPIIDKDYGIDGYKWGYFLKTVFRYWLANGFGTVQIQLFEDCVRGLIGEQPTCCVSSQKCGGFVVEANGNVYCCEHYIDDIGAYLGNIECKSFYTMADSTAFRRFNDRKALYFCKDCQYLRLCGCGCVKHHRTVKNHFCDGYIAFYEEFLREIVPLR